MAYRNTALRRATLVVPITLLAFTGCSESARDQAGDDGAAGSAGADGFDDGGYAEDGGGFDGGAGGDEGGGAGDPGDGAGGDDGGGDGGDGGTPSDPPPANSGTLTAAEWSDLDHWDFWLDLMRGQDEDGASSQWADFEDEWGFDLTDTRVPIVAMAGDAVLVDAAVTLVGGGGMPVWEARTDAHGHADLFAWTDIESQGPFSIRVSAGEAVQTVEIAATREELAGLDQTRQTIEVAAEPVVSDAVDIMFVVDTTGSMGDELGFLQVELADVIDTVQAEAEQAFDLRLSVNFYRDQGDDYVVRSFPFTADIPLALSQLDTQGSGGGGDFPEAMAEAMTDAVLQHEWSEDARARLLFLVLDAPPHHDEARLAQIAEATREAAKLGIRIIPVAGSGIDKSTEFLSRMIDIATGGTYVFLTDDSGIGNSHLEPTVGDFNVELLNNLLTRLVGEAVTVGPA